jgi:very-short-patch-repair endonuclease
MAEESAPHTSGGIAKLAERQHGVLSAAQLYALGFSKDWVSGRVTAGWLHRLHRGVYAVGHRRLAMRGHWMAAVLACGEGAILSHYAAAELWRLRRPRSRPSPLKGRDVPPPIDVTIPGRGGRRRRPGLVIHRTAHLASGEQALHSRIPVTTPDRTILDLAAVLPRRQLERAVDEAHRLRLCAEDDLESIATAHSGRAGAGALSTLLREHHAGSTATRNDFEERFLALCRRYCLPQPEVNVPLLDYIVDFIWPEVRLIVEVDGRATHGTRRAFQEDRDRDGRLAVAGYRVLRFTWWDVTRRPAVVADRVRRLLSAAA